MSENEEKKKYLIYIDKESYPFLVLYLFLIAFVFAYASYIIDTKEKKFRENNLCINRVFEDNKIQVCMYDNITNKIDCVSSNIYMKIQNISKS